MKSMTENKSGLWISVLLFHLISHLNKINENFDWVGGEEEEEEEEEEATGIFSTSCTENFIYPKRLKSISRNIGHCNLIKWMH